MKLTRNNKLIFVVFIVALAISFASSFAYVAYAQKNTEGKTNAHAHSEHSLQTGGPKITITSDDSIKQLKADKVVNLLSGEASPGEIALPVGQVLQFNVRDGKTHRLAMGEGGTDHEHTSDTDSGIFGADEGWRVRFDHPGTFHFHDHLNPQISILVVVYQPSK